MSIALLGSHLHGDTLYCTPVLVVTEMSTGFGIVNQEWQCILDKNKRCQRIPLLDLQYCMRFYHK